VSPNVASRDPENETNHNNNRLKLRYTCL